MHITYEGLERKFIEKSINELREHRLNDFVVKSVRGVIGFQEIIIGRKNDCILDLKYVLNGNMLYCESLVDGVATYRFVETVTLPFLDKQSLQEFNQQLLTADLGHYTFEKELALEEVNNLLCKWLNVEDASCLMGENKNIYDAMRLIILGAISYDEFEYEIKDWYNSKVFSNVDWITYNRVQELAECGKRVADSVISHWLGLKFIANELGK